MNPDSHFTNAVLRALDADARMHLELEPVELLAGEVIYRLGEVEQYAYFPQTAVISLVSAMTNGATASVAMVGREGIVGLSGMFGRADSGTSAVTQIRGTALRVAAAGLRQLRARHAAARPILDGYIQSRLVHVAQIAACNRLHAIEPRLARWLSEVQDRVGTNEFRTSHQSMADMLGVHRPTITIGLQNLQRAGAIATRHRLITIVDRMRLEALSCECHFVLHREFARAMAVQAGNTTSAGGLSDATAIANEALREIAGRLLMASLHEQETREQAEQANRANDSMMVMPRR